MSRRLRLVTSTPEPANIADPEVSADVAAATEYRELALLADELDVSVQDARRAVVAIAIEKRKAIAASEGVLLDCITLPCVDGEVTITFGVDDVGVAS